MDDVDKYILGISDKLNLPSKYKNINISLTELNDVRNIIKKRNRDSHKGTYGRVGILSGSKGMAGAAVLNINAALRSGSGLVKGYITDSIYSIVESMSIEAITHTYNEDNISFDDIKRELIDFSDVIGTGSGCANLKNYSIILNFLLENYMKPIVIDAEGLNLLNLDKLKGHKQDIILTSHYGEMARMLKKDVNYLRENIDEKAEKFAYKYDVYLVLKGARTVISCPNGSVFINTSGNPGMATAGSGDVLTGVISSLIGQNIEISNALRAAVYIHGLAGDIGACHIGEYSLIACDIIKYLPEAFKKVLIKTMGTVPIIQ